MAKLFIGLISGTSMDGVDAVILQESKSHPRQLLAHLTKPYPESLLNPLKSLAKDSLVSMDTLGETDRQLGDFLALTAQELLQRANLKPSDIAAIGSHGQTIRHQPTGNQAYTLQIGDPNRIAEQTGITTVADFRRRDMAAGGEAAPLVPAFHRATFQSPQESRVIVNIGGISNITCLPKDLGLPVTGCDCGPGNTLMDAVYLRHFGKPFDANGDTAARGNINDALLRKMLLDPYFEMPAPKSTGPEYFSPEWLDAHLKSQPHSVEPQEILATLAELTVLSIQQTIHQGKLEPDRLLVCGGGAHNRHLMNRLAIHMTCPVETTEPYGIGPDWVEGAAFAWLACQTLNNLPGNIPDVTGASKAVILGGIYPA